jgi:glycosyltransferase involved in cell wall biosynthesis
MRVLQINKFFYDKGGSERYFFGVSQALAERGHEVLHFSMQHPDNKPSPYSEYFVSPRDYHDSASLPARISRGLAIIRSVEARRRLTQLIRDHRPDVAHLHNIYHQLTPSVIEALGAAGVPTVMTVHDYKLVCPKYSLFDGREYCYRCKGGHYFRAPLARCTDGSFARSALLALEAYWQRATHAYDAVRFMLTPSEHMRGVLVDADYGRDRVIYLRAFIGDDDIAEGNDSAEVDVPQKYLLYCGRLSEEKDVSTLIDAVARVPDVRLLVCGDGPMAAMLEERVLRLGLSERITMMGFVQRPGLNNIIRAARAMVMPSRSPENAPFSVMEAMALGVPVIVSRIGGLPELANMAGGMQFDPGDVEGLVGCINGVWNDDARAATMAEQSRSAAREHFDREAHMKALENIYADAIGSGK